MTLLACNMQNGRQEYQRNYLNSRLSLRLEQENIQRFFDQNDLVLKIDHTEHINPYRIFLHDFTASDNQIRQIIKILELDSVTQKDFNEIHLGEFSNADDKVHSSIGQTYLKDPAILFYKGEISNRKVQEELKVSKVYLYYNRKTKKACFQVYYQWG